jgi:uncharacterized protein (TIGR03086 family)
MAVADDPIEQLEVASDEMARLLATVADTQWSLPTPCAEWNVRQLVAHIIESAARFANIVNPDATSESASTMSPDSYRASVRAHVATLREPGAIEQEYAVPIGIVPGAVVAPSPDGNARTRLGSRAGDRPDHAF